MYLDFIACICFKMKGVEKKDERHETEKLSDAKQSSSGKEENRSSESAPVGGALPTEAVEAGATDRDTAQSKDVHLEATPTVFKEPGWFRSVLLKLFMIFCVAVP